MTKLGRERRRYCSGFISGVEESLRLLGGKQDAAGRGVCVPGGVNARSLAKHYVDFAVQKQGNIEQTAVVTVIEALSNRYPCVQGN